MTMNAGILAASTFLLGSAGRTRMLEQETAVGSERPVWEYSVLLDFLAGHAQFASFVRVWHQRLGRLVAANVSEASVPVAAEYHLWIARTQR